MGIRFSVVPSNNHASPTGALPFLLPSSTSTSSENSPAIPSTKLQRWARAEASSESFNPQSLTSDQESESRKANSKREEPFGMRYEAYMSLVDRQIRHTWVPRHFPLIPQIPQRPTLTSHVSALLSLPRALQLRRRRLPVLHRPLLFKCARPRFPRAQPPRGRQVGAAQALGRHRRRVALQGVRTRVCGAVRASGRRSVFLRQGGAGSVRRQCFRLHQCAARRAPRFQGVPHGPTVTEICKFGAAQAEDTRTLFPGVLNDKNFSEWMRRSGCRIKRNVPTDLVQLCSLERAREHE